MRAILLALLLVPLATAAADWAVLSLGSYHFERHQGYQEVNPGLGFELGRGERWSLVGGAYNNSHSRLSVYAGATYLPWRWQGARFGSLLGVVTGYDAKPLPVVLPMMAIEGERFGVNLVAAPKRGDSPGMVGFQLKWRF